MAFNAMGAIANCLMRMKRTLSLLISLLFLSLWNVSAQYYVVGQDPASVRWKQINTPRFQIIYPGDFESNAQRLAAILEKTYLFAGKTLQHQPGKISVILHTETVRSNGFAAWAPSRVEMFTVPHQTIYPQEWLQQLAIHEYRHVVQIDKIGTELPKIFKIILGEQAASMAIGAYLPFWFLEGDAVATETALSRTGRGRQPSFEMELKAQAQQIGLYSYDKAYLGSYRDHIPNYYQLGYQLVAHGRDKYGQNMWGNILHRVARKTLSLNAFSKGIKLATGKTMVQFYQESLSRFQDSTTVQKIKNTFPASQNVNQSGIEYTSYQYPHFINDSLFFAVKESISDISRFVTINQSGKETHIFTPGSINEESVDFRHNCIIWTETKPDPRWVHREATLLRIYNIQTKKLFEKRFTERIYAPALSPDGKVVTAVKIDMLNQSELVLIAAENGKIIHETKLHSQQQLLTPSWDNNNRDLYAIVLGEKGKSLVKINPYLSTVEYLTPYTHTDIRKPVQNGRYVYFTGSFNGVDNGYAIDTETKQIHRVTNVQYGIRDLQANPEGSLLLYSNYQSNGFQLVKQKADSNDWELTDWNKSYSYPLADKLTLQESIIHFDSTDTASDYPVKKYSKGAHLFNFHSWSPLFVDTEEEEVSAGLSVMSQNKLSTALTELGYRFSSIDNTGKWIAKFQYSGFYPIFDLSLDYGNQKSQYLNITNYIDPTGQVVKSDTTLIGFKYQLFNLKGNIKFPLNLTHGKMYRLLQPEIQIEYTSVTQDKSTPSTIFRGNMIPFTYGLYFHNLLKQSNRDLQSKFGQVINLQFSHTPFGDRNLGQIWSAETIIYLPGLFRNHGVRLYGGFQEKKAGQSMMNDMIHFPRGFQNVVNTELFSLRSDYVLPIVYPDWSIGRLVYLKRIWGRIFYDYSATSIPYNNFQNTGNFSLSSCGAELYADCHFLRFIAPVKIGYRGSYLTNSSSLISEFLFSINLSTL